MIRSAECFFISYVIDAVRFMLCFAKFIFARDEAKAFFENIHGGVGLCLSAVHRGTSQVLFENNGGCLCLCSGDGDVGGRRISKGVLGGVVNDGVPAAWPMWRLLNGRCGGCVACSVVLLYLK